MVQYPTMYCWKYEGTTFIRRKRKKHIVSRTVAKNLVNTFIYLFDLVFHKSLL